MKIISEDKKISLDPAQVKVFKNLEELRHYIEKAKSPKSILTKIKNIFHFKKNIYLNYYIYGDVGRGKTVIMKHFFNNLRIKNKIYLHF